MIRRLAVALSCALLFSSAVHPAHGQRVAGPGDNGWTLPVGVMRIGIAPRLLSARELFDENGNRAPLGAPYSGVLDASTVPALTSLENTIAQLSGVPGFDVRLGVARTLLQNTSSVTPLELEIGVTRFLTLRARAPYHTGGMEAQLLVDGTGATVGVNPARNGGPALATNTLLINGLALAANNLEVLADGCVADPASDERCAQITAELSAVRALIAQTRTVSTTIGVTYGGIPGATPSLFVPLDETTAQSAIAARVGVLRAEFDRYAVESVGVGAAPVAAGAAATVTELQALLTDSAYGYALAPLRRRYQQGFGDIEFGASLMLYDGLPNNTPWDRNGMRRAGFRQTVSATYRAATGTAPDPDDPLRIPTGDGQSDIELGSLTDIVFGDGVWTSLIVRWTKQMSFDGIARIPDGTGALFVPLERRRVARTTPGDRLLIAAAPRWVLSEYLAAGAFWRWSTAGGATVTELAPASGAVPLSYAAPDMSAHEVGIGVTWSSVNPWRNGRARWPLEVSWDRSLVVAGENVPRFRADRISVRVYASLWGR